MLENVTKLNPNFLKNELNYEPKGGQKQQDTKFDDYYIDICALIAECHYLQPSPVDIEEFIKTGIYKYDENNKVACPIKDYEARRDLFLHAQGKQYIYDNENGRGSMFRGEDKEFDVCRDTLRDIRSLGLYQRTPFTV